MEKTIYNLKLHELTKIPFGPEIIRVPGGWIYVHYHDHNPTSTFVPYNEEFKLITKKK